MPFVANIADITAHIAIHKHMRFATLAVQIPDAEAAVQSLIGANEFQSLLAEYEANNFGTNTVRPGTVKLIQSVIAHRVVLAALPFLRNTISELGIQQTYTDDGSTSRPAPVADVKALELAISNGAYYAEEKLLTWLEDHPSDHPDWEAGPGFTVSYETFVRNSHEFSRFTSLITGKKVFLGIKPHLVRIEQDYLVSMLCKDLYNDLRAYRIAEKKSESLAAFPALYPKIIELAQQAEAYLSLEKATHYMSLSIVGAQLYLSDFVAGSDTKRGVEFAAMQRAIDALRKEARNDGERALNQLKTLLDDNAEALPLYFNSACYTKRQEVLKSRTNPDNEGRRSFIMPRRKR